MTPLYQQMYVPCSVTDDGPGNQWAFQGIIDLGPYYQGGSTFIKMFVCPTDATEAFGLYAQGLQLMGDPNLAGQYGLTGPIAQGYGITDNGFGATSYSANVMVMDPFNPTTIPNAMRDGTSNTIMMAERYLNCGWTNTLYNVYVPGVGYGYRWWGGGFNEPAWAFMFNSVGGGASTPGFGWYTAGIAATNPGLWQSPGGFQTDFTSNPVVGAVGTGIAFQVQPTQANCNPTVTQSAHSSMMVGLGDGSVRAISPSISVQTWSEALHTERRRSAGQRLVIVVGSGACGGDSAEGNAVGRAS